VPELQWARDLAAMCQVGLIGYATGGAFLSLVYFDLPYYLVLIVVVVDRIVAREMTERVKAAKAAGTLPRDVHSPYWGGT
jgi:hypothetical protein